MSGSGKPELSAFRGGGRAGLGATGPMQLEGSAMSRPLRRRSRAWCQRTPRREPGSRLADRFRGSGLRLACRRGLLLSAPPKVFLRHGLAPMEGRGHCKKGQPSPRVEAPRASLPAASPTLPESACILASAAPRPPSQRPLNRSSRGETRLSRAEGVAVADGFRPGAGASVSTLTTVPLPAPRTQRAVFPH